MRHGIETGPTDSSQFQKYQTFQVPEYLSEEACRMDLQLTATLIGAASESLEMPEYWSTNADGAQSCGSADSCSSRQDTVAKMLTENTGRDEGK